MKRGGIALLATAVVAAGITTYVVTRPDGNGDTDKKAAEVADRIGYPVGTDGNSYARSALEGNTDPKYFAVLEITDSPTNDPQKIRTSLVFRVYDPGTSESPPSWRLWEEDPVTACYRADFNYYGVTDGGPERIRCPQDARPITPPPAQRTGVPDTYLEAFKTILAELPPAPTQDEVLAALRAKLPPVPVDEQTKLPWVEPRLDAFVKDGNVGIIAGGGGSCLNGVRLTNGTVAAWYPPRVQTQPGEYGCSGQSALALYNVPPPK
ncbi:hypothetical protein FXN61_08515 [Lentzea sp. PSKA42]|uniref:Uncharacterized protein n=1 Tax=Lentzea indica TaxID=2604800 RepID=A0ABX1FD98_9PSEU|nr:hypothetical protein [Lentzea indica]NKE56880.1 hypothetical protein [Lentzea indica]